MLIIAKTGGANSAAVRAATSAWCRLVEGIKTLQLDFGGMFAAADGRRQGSRGRDQSRAEAASPTARMKVEHSWLHEVVRTPDPGLLSRIEYHRPGLGHWTGTRPFCLHQAALSDRRRALIAGVAVSSFSGMLIRLRACSPDRRTGYRGRSDLLSARGLASNTMGFRGLAVSLNPLVRRIQNQMIGRRLPSPTAGIWRNWA